MMLLLVFLMVIGILSALIDMSSGERTSDGLVKMLWIVIAGIFVFQAGHLRTQLEEERAQRYALQTELKACRDANEDTGSD